MAAAVVSSTLPSSKSRAARPSPRAVFTRPWELLGLGCFFAWFQLTRHVVTVPGMSPLLSIVDNRQLLEALLALALVASLIERGIRPSWPNTHAVRAVGLLGAACTCALPALIGAPSAYTPVLACVVLLAACACAAWLALAWCWVFSCASTSRTVAHVLLSVLFARAIGLVCIIPGIVVAVLSSAVLPAISALLLTSSRLPLSRWTPDQGAREEGPHASRLALIALAIALLGFIIGTYKQAYSVNDAPNPGTGPRSVAILLTHVIVMTSLLFVARADLFAGTYRATMFLLAIGCACTPIDADWAGMLSSTLMLWSQFMLMGLVWIIAPRVSLSMGRGSYAYLVGWGFAVFYASSALGSLFYRPTFAVLQTTLPSHAPIQLAMLLCVLTVHFLMIREQDIQRLVDLKESEYRQGREALLAGCRAMAAAHALSERESELLPRWVLGETAPQIAEELSISESTVRTHVRHIYVKTGTHGRSELMELVRTS